MNGPFRCGECGEDIPKNRYHSGCNAKYNFDHALRRTCSKIQAEAGKQNATGELLLAEAAKQSATGELLLAEAKKQRRSARRRNKHLRQDIAALTAAVNRLADCFPSMSLVPPE